MNLSTALAEQIITASRAYLGRPYDWRQFDCVHFVLQVYKDVGIELPRLSGQWLPPHEFHLSGEELVAMPIGHPVFLKRKLSQKPKIWTHVAIIYSPTEVIHCSRHFGRQVAITPVGEILATYAVAPKPPM